MSDIHRRRDVSKEKWYPECIEASSDGKNIFVLASDHIVRIKRSGRRSYASVFKTNLEDIRGMALSPCENILYLANSSKNRICAVSIEKIGSKILLDLSYDSRTIPSMSIPVDIAFARSDSNDSSTVFALVTCYKNNRVVKLNRDMREIGGTIFSL